MEYNEAQNRAICHLNGPALVLAGPGAGKTTVLTGRVKYLIEKGIRASSILVVTFTKAAAKEMKARFMQSGVSAGEGVTFATCHALFFRILCTECGYSGKDILSDAKRRALLGTVMRSHGMDADEEMLRYALADISRLKNTQPSCGGPADGTDAISGSGWCDEETFRSIYEAYNAQLRAAHQLEFDDMAPLCLNLFDTSPGILEKWQRRWSRVLVDEFQDINPAQYRLLCLLAQPEDHFFAVGDEDQSIYAFRGASPQLILQFEEDHPGAEKILLDLNYRCPQEILLPAQHLIEKNTLHISKAVHAVTQEKGEVRVINAADAHEEARRIAADLQTCLDQGIRADQMAVLSRSSTSFSCLMHELTVRMIPCRMKRGEQDVYSHWIAKDLFAYLILAQEPENRTMLLRILNRPERLLPREVFTQEGLTWSERERMLSAEEAKQLRTLSRDLDRIRRFSPYAALHYIIDGIGYGQVMEEETLRLRLPEETLQDLLQVLYEEAAGYETISEWRRAVERKRLRARESGQREEGVLLSTIHGAKGLEFDRVYLMDVNEGLLPLGAASSPGQIEEERRLCYVAMTRARRTLILCTLSRYHAHEVQPSRFLREAQLVTFHGAQPARGSTMEGA